MRIVVTLACSECKSRNYTTTKKREKRTQKLELRKYCKRCRKHTIHKETR